MLYNKNNVRKTNDKKVLHKVGKQWKVVSIALLMAIGGGAAVAATNNNANADVNVNDANQVNQEASELTDNNFTAPASSATSSSATSKSAVAPSLASVSYAPSSRVQGHNASAAYYNNHYNYDKAAMDYYGPVVSGYVKSMNAKFPEARNLQSSYNTASTNASTDSSAASSYANTAANASNQSLISAMASKAGVPTTSAFVDSVEYQTSNYTASVSNGSNESNAMAFVNSLVNGIINGNPSLSYAEASASAQRTEAYSISASNVSAAYSNVISGIISASASNQSALDAATFAEQSASNRAYIAGIYSSEDVDAVMSAAHVASNVSANSYANSNAVSSAVSSEASTLNSSIVSLVASYAKDGANFTKNENIPSAVSSYNSSVTSATFNWNTNNGGVITNALNGFNVGGYNINSSNGQPVSDVAMIRDVSDTAAISAKSTIFSSANAVISAAKAFQSQHANDLSSASVVAANDKANSASASQANAMAQANSAITSVISSAVVSNGSTNSASAVSFVNSLLGDPDNLAGFFDDKVAANQNPDNYFTSGVATAAYNKLNDEYNYVESVANSANSVTDYYFDVADVSNFLTAVSASSGFTGTGDNRKADSLSTDVQGNHLAVNNVTTVQGMLSAASENADENDNENWVANAKVTGLAMPKADGSAYDDFMADVKAVGLENNNDFLNNTSKPASSEFVKMSDAAKVTVTAASASASSADSYADSLVNSFNAINQDDYTSAMAKSNFNSAANASASAAGVDLSILTDGSKNTAFSDYASAVTSAEASIAAVNGNPQLNTASNLSSATKVAQSSATSSYDSTVSASAKYSANMDVDVTLASYFASSDNSAASSEATIASSASSALSSFYDDKADNSAFSDANNKYNAASNAEAGNKKMANANGIFVLEHSPQFVTLTKNAELHDSVAFGKGTSVRAAKKGEQFAVKAVGFDEVGTLRYVVDYTKAGKPVYLTANDSYVEPTYLEPDGYYTVKLNHGVAAHAGLNFNSKVVKTYGPNTELTGQAVPTVANKGKYDYYFGVSRLKLKDGSFITTNDKYVSVVPDQTNNNNNGSSASANNMQPANYKNSPKVFF